MIIPTLQTESLTLRAPAISDLADETEFYASKRSVHVGGPANEGQVWNMIAMMLGHWHIHGFGFWGIEDTKSGQYYGRVGLWMPHGWPEPELGWAIMGPAEGKSIAYHAAKAARDYAYQTLNWTTLISLIGPSNTRSAKLAERLGCTFEKAQADASEGAKFIWRHPAPRAVEGLT